MAETPPAIQPRISGIAGIGAVAIVVLGLGAVISFLNGRARQHALLQQSRDQLRLLAARLHNAREEERSRVAREIHDVLGQALTTIKIDVVSLMRGPPLGQQQAVKRAESVLRLVDDTIQSVRRLATELRPAILDHLGLGPALEWVTREFQHRTGIRTRISLPDAEIALDPDRSTALFRILQEALTNIARHAKATDVEVRLARDDAGLLLEVHDNGVGFNEAELRPGESLGILGMRERALLLDGDLAIRSGSGTGTIVIVRIAELPAGVGSATP